MTRKVTADIQRWSGTWPAIALHSRPAKQVVLLQLTVPCESRIEEHVAVIRLLALGEHARCLVSTLAYDALKQFGLREQSRSRDIKRQGEAGGNRKGQ